MHSPPARAPRTGLLDSGLVFADQVINKERTRIGRGMD
jgi:hypothetical protein